MFDTVDSLVKQLTVTADKLRKLAVKKQAEADKMEAQLVVITDAQNASLNERSRAVRVAEKIEAMVA